MTERYQAPPHGTSPDDERPAPDAERAQAPVAAAPDARTPQSAPPGTQQEAAAGEGRHSEPFSIDAEQGRLAKERAEQEQERLVWTPPLPQYPPRPTRQEPVQYEAPRPQPAPQYAPQSYVPQPPAPPPTSAPHPSAQQQYAPAIAGGYSAPVANPYGSHGQVVTAPPAPRASKARVGRRIMRRTVRGTSAVGKKMFGVRPGLMVALLLVVLFTGWLAYDKWMVGGGTNSATPNAATKNGTVPLPPETASVQSYLTAMQKGDTDAVWNALGPQEKAHRISRGDDKTVLDAILKMEQQQGFTYATYHYIAGYGKDGAADPTKGGVYFYVADVGRGAQKTAVPMVFVMDANGQINQVSDQLYDYMLQQMKGGN